MHRLALLCAVVVALPAVVSAQVGGGRADAPSSTLRVIVLDQTGAAIVGAAVQVTPAGAQPLSATSDGRGQAFFPELPGRRAHLRVESPGFARHETPISLRRGGNNQIVTLRLATIEEELVVSENDFTARRGNAFTTTLDEADLASLPDDPDEFEEALRMMAGGDAVFQVNGFRGGRLPPKNQIRQIRFRTNVYAAENHEAGHAFVEVITKPGMSGWGGAASMGLRHDVLNARNAFAQARTPEQFRRFSGNVSGPLQKERTSFLFGVDGNASYDSQTVVAQTPAGRVADHVRRPVARAEVTAGIEHALTARQTVRLEYQRRGETRRNLGVGDFALPERAFTRETEVQQLRASVNSIVGRTTFNELRLELRDERSSQRPERHDPAVVVIDAFLSGGAGVESDRAVRALDLSNNTDFTVGRHVFRAGLRLETGSYRLRDARNANGTFTFGSLDAYRSGRPATYTQRVGDAETSFSQYQLGLYIQDDFRIGKNLSVSAGVREELQTHVSDKVNFMPRAAFSWNPRGVKTTIRGGYGVFHDWLAADVYDQSLRVNGISQRDLLILDPGYPDPYGGGAAVVLPGGRVEMASRLNLPSVQQFSIGVERSFADALTLQVSVMRQDGRSQLRSVNGNAPDENGARPEPGVGTVARIESAGRSRTNRLYANANYRVPQTRTMVGVGYILSDTRNHADNPLALPADSRNPDADWGPAAQDVRHRLFAMINVALPKGLRGGVMSQAQSGLPYTITTGRDDNADGVINDRPAGIARNTARGAWRWVLNMRLSRGFGFGGERQGGEGGPAIRSRMGEDDGPAVMMMERSNERFRADFYVQGFNLLNRTNYLNYSGNLQSPFFGRPSAAGPARRLEVGMQFAF